MALACPITEHPVGTGSFCRICGRDYVTVPDPVVAEAPAPPEPAAVEAAPPLPPPMHQPDPEPAPRPVDPVLDTNLIETRFAQMTAPEAPLGDLATAVEPEPTAEQTPAAKSPRAVPPAVLHALAGGGVGAVLMALVDRLVL